MPIVGDPLTAPEAGWKRYDDKLPLFMYPGSGWRSWSDTNFYNGSSFRTNVVGSYVSFDFIGTKFRYIASRNTDESSNIIVEVDGVNVGTVNANGSLAYQVLLFELTGLPNTRHNVRIINQDSRLMYLDAIDIDDTGRLLHPDEVTDINDLQVGKRIRCHYRAGVSRQVGLLSDLGRETYMDGINDFIPAVSSATPDGDFYFIMVDGYNGKKYCIADRNIQHSILWDTLNTAGIASGSGLPLNGVFQSRRSPKNYLAVDDKFKLRTVGDVTISAKVLVPSITDDLFVLYAGYGETNANNVLYSLGVNSTGYVYFGHEYGGGVNSFIDSTFQMPLNEVVDLTVTRDATSKKYDLYVNGVFHSSYTYADNPTFTDPSSHKLYIGGNVTTSGTPGMDVTFYNLSIDNRYVSQSDFPTYNEAKYVDDKLFSLNALASNEQVDYAIRLMTGGVNSNDKDNEWDKYIVNSTLNGTITAGDNAVWNWDNIWSLTSTTHTEGASYRTVRGYSLASGSSRVTASEVSAITNGFRPVLIIKSPVTLYFVQDGTDIKTLVSGSWVTLGSAPVTDSMLPRGMTDLRLCIPYLNQLVNKNNIKFIALKPEREQTQFRLTGVPTPRIVKMKNDISFLHASNIDSLTLTANQSGNGALLLAVSFDGGVTWEARDGSGIWVNININDKGDFKAKGMTIATFNTISNWTSRLGTNRTIRIAFYFEQQTATDVSSVDTLSMQLDLVGSWDMAIPGVDYKYGYNRNTNLRVLLMSNGDFKINVGSGLTEIDGGAF